MFIITVMNLFRYRGKKSPDKILAEICWWMKNVFEATQEVEEGIEVVNIEDDDDDVMLPYDDYGDIDYDSDHDGDDDVYDPVQKRPRT